VPASLTPSIRRAAPVVGLVVVLAFGVVLRVVTRSDLWLDEALSTNIASLPLGDITDALRRDGHPPLYYVLLHGWMNVFGDSDLAVRSLSAVASLLSLPFVWIIARERRNRAAAAWAVALCAVLPFNTRYATEARMYALLMLLIVAGWWLLEMAVRTGAWRWLAGVAVITSMLLYTHYWSMWLLAGAGLVVLAIALRGPDSMRSGAWRSAGAMVVGGLSFLPWVPVLLDQLAHTGTPWGDPQRPTMSVALVLSDLAGGETIAEASVALILFGLLLVLGLTGVPRPPSSVELDLRTVPGVRAEAVVATIAIAVGTAVAWLTGSTFASRYGSIVVPLLIVIAGVGVVAVPNGWRRALIGGATVVLFALVAVAAAFDQRTQGAEVAAALSGEAQPGDVVLVCPDQLGPAMSRNLTADVEVLTHPALTGPEFVDWRDYAERNAAADTAVVADEVRRRAGANDIWFVWMSGYTTYDSQCEDLKARLAEGRAEQTVVTARRGEVFEPMWLERFSVAD
jgi:mannosyltransferase